MSKKFAGALLWAIKSESKQALTETIQRILAAGYAHSDISTIIGEIHN